MIEQSRYNLVVNAIDRFWSDNGYAPTISQLATMTGLTYPTVQDVLTAFAGVMINGAVISDDEADTKEFEIVQLIDDELETKEYPVVRIDDD